MGCWWLRLAASSCTHHVTLLFPLQVFRLIRSNASRYFYNAIVCSITLQQLPFLDYTSCLFLHLRSCLGILYRFVLYYTELLRFVLLRNTSCLFLQQTSCLFLQQTSCLFYTTQVAFSALRHLHIGWMWRGPLPLNAAHTQWRFGQSELAGREMHVSGVWFQPCGRPPLAPW